MLLFYFTILAYQIFHGNSQNKNGTSLSQPKCEEVIKHENPNLGRNKASFKSLFHQVFSTGCLICAKPECDYEDFLCATWASFGLKPLFRIPLYNNILEFGLSGIYFPEIIDVRIKINDICFFRVYAWLHKGREKLDLRIEECNFNQSLINCKKITSDLTYPIKDKDQFCFYFGFALYEKDRIYTTATADCELFASALFRVEKFFKIQDRNCLFDREKDKPIASYRFFQNKRNLKVIGIPVILPCNPGGFVVDPNTGRFVYGTNCWKMFSNSLEGGKGINFLIKKMYNNNEYLKFPYRYGGKHKFVNTPIYLDSQNMGKERRLMAAKNETYLWIKGKERDICEFYEIGKERSTARRGPGPGNEALIPPVDIPIVGEEGNTTLTSSNDSSLAGEEGGEDTNDSDIFPITNNILIAAQMLFILKFK